MADIILHIGAHKTATTALQRVLSQSSDHLKDYQILYPKICWFQYAQHRLAFSLKNLTDPVGRDKPDKILEIEDIKKVIDRHPGLRILLSSEELFTLPLDSLSFLSDSLSQHSVRIIACLRRPDEMLLSIYNQKAKTPNNAFIKPLSYFLEHPHAIDPDISYGQQLGKWMDFFGTEALSVFTYEQARPIDNFFAVLGIPAPPQEELVVNSSVPAAVVETMRLAKTMAVDPLLQQRLYHLALQHFKNTPRLSLADNERRNIFASFKDEYDTLFSRLGRPNPYSPDRFDFSAETVAIQADLIPSDYMNLIDVVTNLPHSA